MGLNLSSHILESFQTFFSTIPVMLEHQVSFGDAAKIFTKAFGEMGGFLSKTAGKKFSGGEGSGWSDAKTRARMKYFAEEAQRLQSGWAQEHANMEQLDFIQPLVKIVLAVFYDLETDKFVPIKK